MVLLQMVRMATRLLGPSFAAAANRDICK